MDRFPIISHSWKEGLLSQFISKHTEEGFLFKTYNYLGRNGGTPLILALWRQRQVNLCKFEARLVYMASFRPVRVT